MAKRSSRSGTGSRRDARAAQAFGETLRSFRLTASMTQEDLALRCSMDRAYISELERGLKEPCLATLLKLARELQTTTAAMMGDVEERLLN